MALKFANNASSTLAGAINAVATSMSVQSGDAGKFPVLGVGDYCFATLTKATGEREVVKVTARSGAVLTMTRGQDGTTALSFASGDRVDCRLSLGALLDLQSLAGLPSGSTAKTNLGLGNVDNTADASKPVSTAQQAAIDAGIATLSALVLAKADNLNSVASKPTARTNLDVYNKAETLAHAPVGSMMMWPKNTAPTGFLERNGAAISRTTYAALFAVIGTTFGTGDGSTTFNLPDDRGLFERGWDHGRGTADTGRTFGSEQTDDVKAHTHTASSASAGAHAHDIDLVGGFGSEASVLRGSGAVTNQGTTKSAGAHSHTITVDSAGIAETRVRNRAYLPIIKYQ